MSFFWASVEIVDGELWGVMTAGLKESLSGEETAELLDFVTGQNSDGYVPKNNMRRSRPNNTLTPLALEASAAGFTTRSFNYKIVDDRIENIS